MKLRNKIVALFLTVACAFGLAVAGNATKVSAEETTYSYTFSATQFSANGTKTLNNVDWTLAGNGGYWGFDTQYGKGQQFGSSKLPYKTMTLTSDVFEGVTKVTITTAGASSITATLDVLVGGTSVGTYKLTSSNATKTFEVAPTTGAVCFSYTQTSSKAIYIKSIEVVYGAAAAELTDAEKAVAAMDALSLDKTFVMSDITLPSTGIYDAEITWESDYEDIIDANGNVVRPTEDTIVTLNATIKVGDAIEHKEFEVTVKGLDRTIVTNPVAGTKYLLMVSQEANKLDNFVNGSMANTYYFATTTNAAQAKTVELVEVEDGFHLLMGTKYINVVASGTHINAVYQDAPSSVWTFDTTNNTLVTVLSGKTYCLNSYGTYNTVSPSEVTGATYFAHLVELTEQEKLEALVQVGYQVGTKDEAKALRLVAEFDFTAEEVANFDKEISFRVTHNDVADERVVTTLYSSVNPMNDEEVLEDGYYAVLTYVNIPAGEYLVEVLVDGVVAATVTATVA